MYNKDAQKEILCLLRQMNDKLDHLSSMAAPQQEEDPLGNRREPLKNSSSNMQSGTQNKTMWNLTQSQYEVSNELFEGIKKLKSVILEGEKRSTRAKREYKN